MDNGERERNGTAECVAGCCAVSSDSEDPVVCICLRLVAGTTSAVVWIILRKYLKIFDS